MTPARLLARRGRATEGDATEGDATDGDATDGDATDGDADDGSAIIEFVFVAVVMLVPLVYLIAAVAVVQRTSLAVTTAARDAGRAYATSETTAQAAQRASVAVRLALADQGIDADDADVRVVVAGAGCESHRVAPALDPGAEFTVCVTHRVRLPGIPSVLAGRGVTSVGSYTVHVDDFREAPGA